MNWCGWGTEAIERYRQKLKVIHYRHQGRSAEIMYVWDVLMKRIEADTEAPGLLVAHKEYGILEKAPSQAIWVIWDKIEADQKPGLERVFMLSFPKEYFVRALLSLHSLILQAEVRTKKQTLEN